jgi:hypothetical protein
MLDRAEDGREEAGAKETSREDFGAFFFAFLAFGFRGATTGEGDGLDSTG